MSQFLAVILLGPILLGFFPAMRKKSGVPKPRHRGPSRCRMTFRATPPFDRLWPAINVHRIDVVSTDSGADDPVDCPDAPGSGAGPRTFFDASFCSVAPGDVRISRLLTVNADLAEDVAKRRSTGSLPDTRDRAMRANTAVPGGKVAVCSTDSRAAHIALHEIGHSAFKLGDEYGGDGTGAPMGEPEHPNVTRDKRAAGKWHALIAPTTPLPTACAPGCADCEPPANPPPSGTVGTYEGGMYSDCGIYRPLPECKMRTLTKPFCPVCSTAIRDKLAIYQPDEIAAPIA